MLLLLYGCARHCTLLGLPMPYAAVADAHYTPYHSRRCRHPACPWFWANLSVSLSHQTALGGAVAYQSAGLPALPCTPIWRVLQRYFCSLVQRTHAGRTILVGSVAPGTLPRVCHVSATRVRTSSLPHPPQRDAWFLDPGPWTQGGAVLLDLRVRVAVPPPQRDAWFLDPVLTADMADEPVGALLDLSSLVQADKNLQVGAGVR